MVRSLGSQLVGDVNNKLRGRRPAPAEVYQWLSPGFSTKNSLRHFAYPSPNFAGIKKCDIWPQFLITVAFAHVQ